MTQKDIVLFSTADWDNPFWTNKQHVATELGRRGHRVLYIDSIGLRQPSVNGADISRIAKRLFKAIRSPKKVADNIWVWSPLVIPFQRYALVRNINKRLFSVGLWWNLFVLGMRREIFWTYNPMTLKITSIRGYGTVVYHCVDEIKEQPGMPVEEIVLAEKELTSSADVCFVTAQKLLQTRKEWNKNTYYFPNVADYAHFSSALSETTEIPADLTVIPEPRVGFIGAISGYKMDFKLLLGVARARPQLSIVLIGKIGEGDPGTNADELRAQKNIYLLGPRSYSDLPAYLKGFNAALLPSAINEYTNNMFPMKFFEYLAAGRPVVSTDLLALQDYKDVAFLAKDGSEFVRGIDLALEELGAPLALRLAAAEEQTYTARTGKMLNIIAEIEATK